MTFTELFTDSNLNGLGLEQLAYILDAPQEMFDAVKNDLLTSIVGEIDNGNFLKQISANEDVDIQELKTEMVEMYDNVSELINQEDFNELPQDRKEFFLDLLGTLRDKCLELPERKVVEIVYEKLDKDVILPTYAHNTDAGADIYANEDIEISGHMTELVSTGIKVAVPVGWELQIRPRSGMSLKTPIRIANAPGTIDSGYRDEVKVICHNTSPYPYTIHKGDRIAQFIPKVCPMITWKEGKVNDIGENRSGGFGSTGK